MSESTPSQRIESEHSSPSKKPSSASASPDKSSGIVGRVWFFPQPPIPDTANLRTYQGGPWKPLISGPTSEKVESLPLSTVSPNDSEIQDYYRELVGQAVVSPIRADVKLEPWPPPVT